MSRSLRHRSRAVLVAVGAVACLLAFGSVPSAMAAGNTKLDAFIVKNPLSGWVSLPSRELTLFNSVIQGIESPIGREYHIEVKTAVEGWGNPSAPRDVLVVFIIGLQVTRSKQDVLLGGMPTLDSSAARSFCGATPPASDILYRPVPNAHEVTCAGSTGGMRTRALTFSKANLAVLVMSDSLAPNALQAISARQYAALPGSITAIT